MEQWRVDRHSVHAVGARKSKSRDPQRHVTRHDAAVSRRNVLRPRRRGRGKGGGVDECDDTS